MPLEKFHPGEYLADELEARGWTTRDCAERMGGDVDVDTLALDMLIACANAQKDQVAHRVRLGKRTAEGLSRAMGTSAETWLNLDESYHSGRAAPQEGAGG